MILVINAGSSSIKAAIFSRQLECLVTGMVSEIGAGGMLNVAGVKTPVTTEDHAAALDRLLDGFARAGFAKSDLTAAAHRIVHGGTRLTRPARVSETIINEIRACITIAPLHNPVNLMGIEALAKTMPDLPQYASFDTAFHATAPELETRYAIPAEWHDQGVQRYGFHGLSYANLVADFPGTLPARLLALHLGNGSSLCAIKDGRSVATSMGYSPISGLVMGTRAGDIDGTAILRLAQEQGFDAANRLLNKSCGLKAMAGDSNMQALLSRDDDAAKFAVQHYCYWAARHAGSAVVAMGGVDAVAFTGGIGENAIPIRDQIMAHLACFGDLPVHVIPANEEKQIARDALGVMEAER